MIVVGYQGSGEEEDVTFDYTDGWDEMMEDARPAILEQVEILRGQ